eukprot:CAMPEP_0175857774 /NCGR_PEP_ID=MMETSP0107_2-20121207/29281_1 /TAXON_ID=195067 ORGANISM="Goniomonas pacifica, Strain CCMP1869" /NCGR_SAMPLE_ID=MMETSP0107_2 /ASSEMBLY_ACC=CAM_ASM_000203 /LENGTH=253 /DNA_ID=CAMNT_0017174109 /DNA_START=438 /DNA_END=1200 /DNA_ORIENTATION=+
MTEVKKWIEEVDDDESGTIEFPEFCQLMTSKIMSGGGEGGDGRSKMEQMQQQVVRMQSFLDGRSKMEQMQQQLLQSGTISGAQAKNADAALLTRIGQLDKERLDIIKAGMPAAETMALAKEYREIAEKAQTDRIQKMATWWAKDVIERLKRHKQEVQNRQKKQTEKESRRLDEERAAAAKARKGSLFARRKSRKSVGALGGTSSSRPSSTPTTPDIPEDGGVELTEIDTAVKKIEERQERDSAAGVIDSRAVT